MEEENTIDPYKSPTTRESSKAGVSNEESVLKDLRPLGWLAITAILIQLIANLVSASIPKRPDLIATLMVVQGVTFLFAALSFLPWVFLAANNALRMNPRGGLRPVWSAACYFVPFANFVCPFLEMRKLVKAAFRSSSGDVLQIVVVVWWVSFMLRTLIIKVGISPEVIAVWAGASIVSAICVFVLIFRISAKQAAFRWTEHPTADRPVMTPLGGHRANIPQRRSQPTSPSIEDGWGS